jgi:transcriptional regulator of acetoin/glycerol metabolism
MKDAAADGEALTMMANAELSPGFKHAERVLTAVHSSRAAVSAVAASWCRSALHHGLDPSAPQASAERLGDNELNTLRASNGELLTVAAPCSTGFTAASGWPGPV